MVRNSWQRATTGRWSQSWLSGHKPAGLSRHVAVYVCFIFTAAVGIAVVVQTSAVVSAYASGGGRSPHLASGGQGGPGPYAALQPQLWRYAVTEHGHFMRQAGGLQKPDNSSSSASVRHGGSGGAGGLSGGRGQAAGRPLPDLYICYAVEGGLMNQHYIHLNAVAAAVAIGAKGVVMPPVKERLSWTQYKRTKWRAAPADRVWDIASLRAYAQARGVAVAVAPAAKFPAKAAPSPQGNKQRQRGRQRSAPPPPAAPLAPPCICNDYRPFSIKGSYEVLPMPSLRFGLLTPAELAEHMKEQLQLHISRSTMVSGEEAEADEEEPGEGRRPLFLSFPSLLFAMRTRSQPLLTEVASNLHFSPHLRMIAQRVRDDMVEKARGRGYNAMHLRVEKDAFSMLKRQDVGGASAAWELYHKAAADAGFSRSTPLFMASGIFNAKMPVQMAKRLRNLTNAVASVVWSKTPFLTEDERTTLSQEQSGVVDFLLLSHAQRLVVFDHSSMSMFAVEYRRLHGIRGAPPTCVLHLRCKASDPEAKTLTNGQEFTVFPRKQRGR